MLESSVITFQLFLFIKLNAPLDYLTELPFYRFDVVDCVDIRFGKYRFNIVDHSFSILFYQGFGVSSVVCLGFSGGVRS